MISKAFMAFGAVMSGSVSDSCGLNTPHRTYLYSSN